MSRSILFCHCTWARVVDASVKAELLETLAGSDAPFEAVPDLCELAARKDPRLAELAAAANTSERPLRIAACFPRAVRWLFAAAGSELPETVAVHNMRETPADELSAQLLAEEDAAPAEPAPAPSEDPS